MQEIAGTTMATEHPLGNEGKRRDWRTFQKVAELGGVAEPTTSVAIPQTHMVLDVIRAETGKNHACCHITHRKL